MCLCDGTTKNPKQKRKRNRRERKKESTLSKIKQIHIVADDSHSFDTKFIAYDFLSIMFPYICGCRMRVCVWWPAPPSSSPQPPPPFLEISDNAYKILAVNVSDLIDITHRIMILYILSTVIPYFVRQSLYTLYTAYNAYTDGYTYLCYRMRYNHVDGVADNDNTNENCIRQTIFVVSRRFASKKHQIKIT